MPELPRALESEAGLLGALLIDAKAVLPELLAAHPNADRLFTCDRNREIFEAICTLATAGQPVDAVTVVQTIGTTPELASYVAQLPDKAPIASNALWHAGQLREAHTKRAVFLLCHDFLAKTTNATPADELLASLQSEIITISRESTAGADFGIKDAIHQTIEHLEGCHANKGRLRGLATGFGKLDWLTRGLRPGQLVIIGARPACGKTSLAMNIAEHVAIDQGLPVAVFSLEMTKKELIHRMVLSRAEIPTQIADTGNMTEANFARLAHVNAELLKAPLRVCDFGGITLQRLGAIARRLAFEYHGKLSLVVVDYIQLMRGAGRKTDNRNLELAEISGGLKALAKELALPVIALSQLNRDYERDGNRRPRLSDLRDSGAIEQDADIVGFLHAQPETEGQPQPDPLPVDLRIEKHRNGPRGVVHLQFRQTITRFELKQ